VPIDFGVGAMKRNPPWKRDELILALDLYVNHKRERLSASHPRVIELSRVLNALPIHDERPDAARFRNSNGVYMKLSNFLRFDSTYRGKGLSRGNREEKDVWDEFASDAGSLASTAAAIRARVDKRPGDETITDRVDDEEEFPEGAVLFRSHRSRERNRAVVTLAKKFFIKQHGKLACAACNFSFAARYGQLGEGYIECHHTVPISKLSPGAKTKVKDLIPLCANCHRMVHRRRPWLAPSDLKTLLRE
jgi:5-methylcytosine-specific restriction protein A